MFFVWFCVGVLSLVVIVVRVEFFVCFVSFLCFGGLCFWFIRLLVCWFIVFVLVFLGCVGLLLVVILVGGLVLVFFGGWFWWLLFWFVCDCFWVDLFCGLFWGGF